MTVHVGIVDDHVLLAHSVVLALEGRGLSAQRYWAEEPMTLVWQVIEAGLDVLILDLELGPPLGCGTDLLPDLRSAGLPVLVCTGVKDPLLIAAAVEAGAAGVLAKDAPLDELVAAVDLIAKGGRAMGADEHRRHLSTLREHRAQTSHDRKAWDALTEREREVLAALARGHGVTRIAKDRWVSVSTVRSQVQAILSKLGVSSQLEAVAIAAHRGWLKDPDGRAIPGHGGHWRT